MTAEEREASLDRICEQDEPPRAGDYGDVEPFTAEELAEIREAAADELLAVEAATTGRRGPGQPGSARIFPGESSSPAAGFGPGMALDVLPGCAGLAVAADAAAGDDGFAGVSEAELIGVHVRVGPGRGPRAARKLAAIAELGRRNPGPQDAGVHRATSWPTRWGSPAARADEPAGHGRSPGHPPARHEGRAARGHTRVYKAEIIAAATALLDTDEARAAEAEVLDRAARLTPGGLRAAIARAVIEAAPEKAKERRETAARNARVERWAEDSGNAALMGCELPPDEVLAADQQITAWARELNAGRAGRRHGPAPRPRLPRPAAGQGLPPRPGRRPARPAARRGPARPGSPAGSP